jgi:hypothetical protein
VADPTFQPRDDQDTGATAGTPRWVKAFGAVAAVLVLVFLIVMLTGGPGAHGPGRHTGSDGRDEQRSPSSAPKEHRPPPGADHR